MLVPLATTVVSLGMWLSIQPDDDEIGTVMSGWSTVAEELGHVSTLGRMASDGDPLPRSVWDDDAWNAFDTWARNFQTEVTQAADEAPSAPSTTLSWPFRRSRGSWVHSHLQPVRPRCFGGSRRLSGTHYGYKMHQVFGAGAFHKLQINNDPDQPYGADNVNDTFTDLDMGWLT